MRYFPHKFRRKSSELLNLVKSILKKYEKMLPLTLRQIFYLVISLEKSPLENTLYDYQRLSRLLRDARYSGDVSFEWIEDRTRYASNLTRPLEEIIYYYYPEAWEYQPYYIEVFVEKEGLRSFFQRILRPFYIPITPMRGFDSLSDIMNAAERIHKYKDRPRLIFIFSDFDPSGESISQDFEFRLKKCLIMLGEDPTFFVENKDMKRAEVPNLLVYKIALTQEQVEKYNLPPKFVKPKDPRASTFIEKYGLKAVVELDAMPPEVLEEIILEAIIPYLDLDEVERIRKIEWRVKTEGLEVLESLTDLEEEE